MEAQRGDVAADAAGPPDRALARLADELVGEVDGRRRRSRAAEVGRGEAAVAVGVDLDGAVAAQQHVVEEDRHLGDERRAVEVVPAATAMRGDEVLAPVRAQLGHRALRAGQHDGHVDAVEQEAERRRGEGHRVGAVQHDHADVTGRVLDDGIGDGDPVGRCP